MRKKGSTQSSSRWMLPPGVGVKALACTQAITSTLARLATAVQLVICD
jgi:hypothetical protein